jgi:hypothetical protein
MLIQGSDTTTESQLLMSLWNAKQDPDCDSLILNDVEFDVTIVSALIDTLQSKHTWKSIKVHNCVGGAIVYDVLWAICTRPGILSFELDQSISSVGSQAFSSIGYALNYSKTLKHLTLRARTIDHEAGTSLARGLARNTDLEHLDLGGSAMIPAAIGPLSFGLRLNRTLHTLKLDGCGLEDSDMAMILRALQDHPQLKVLSITQNQCHDEGMGAIATLLHYNDLEELDMSYLVRKTKQATPTPEVPVEPQAKIDEETVEDETSKNDTENATSEQADEKDDQQNGANDDADAAGEETSQTNQETEAQDTTQKVCNTHLKRFAMAGNFLSDGFLESLLGIFGSGSALEELNLFGNRITDYGLGLIIHKIPQWKHLRSLWLGQNCFPPWAAERLLEMLKTNYTILDVNIRSFDDSQMDTIQDQLDHYCRLNQGGRRILASDKSTIPLSLWSLVMERTQRVFGGNADQNTSATGVVHSHSVDALYCLLRGPAIFENPRIMG